MSSEFQTVRPWELLHADDLAMVVKSFEEVMNRLSMWKLKFGEKGLKLNESKTKIFINGRGLNTIKELDKFPCNVCFKAIGVNSAYCSSCKHLALRCCSRGNGCLVSNENFQYKVLPRVFSCYW